MEDIKTDILIVGCGGGALRAAIEASASGAQVLLAAKGKLGKSGATAYQVSEMAGFNCPSGVKEPTDSPAAYYEDMMAAAQGMAIPKLVQIVADNAFAAKKELEDWGVGFKKENGKDYAFLSCFSKKARTLVIPGHGEPIIKACTNHLPASVRISEETMILSLLVKDDTCVGAYAVKDGGTFCIWAKAVILGTGGAGQLFEKNMNPEDITGDGYALGYLAGAELMNMEFMQAGIGISHPGIFLLNAYIWGGLPEIRDRNHQSIFSGQVMDGKSEKEILLAHQHHFPFSTGDISKYFEISIQKALRENRGTKRGGVFCDMSHMSDGYVSTCGNQFGLHEMWPVAKAYFLSRGLDVETQQTEISCFAHAINGGLKIGQKSETNIQGLYAVGENAGGPHGADRLGGNMMLTCQIFGKIAGRAASDYARHTALWDKGSHCFAEELEKTKACLYADIPVKDWKKQIQKLNQEKLLILRNKEGLLSLQNTYGSMERELLSSGKNAKPNYQAAEVRHMLITSRLMAYAAEKRSESRGSHYREDKTGRDEAYGKPILIKKIIEEKKSGEGIYAGRG